MEQLIELVIKGFGPAGAAVIVASWGVIAFLWRNRTAVIKDLKTEIKDERERNESLQEKRLSESMASLKTVTDSLATIRAMRGGTS